MARLNVHLTHVGRRQLEMTAAAFKTSSVVPGCTSDGETCTRTNVKNS
jgi:hypothetical protein